MKRADVKLWPGLSVTVSGPSVTGGWSADGFVVCSAANDCVIVSAGERGLFRVRHDGGYWVDSAYISYVDGEEITE